MRLRFPPAHVWLTGMPGVGAVHIGPQQGTVQLIQRSRLPRDAIRTASRTEATEADGTAADAMDCLFPLVDASAADAATHRFLA